MTQKILQTGAFVVANDLSQEHLNRIWSETMDQGRLKLLLGGFPNLDTSSIPPLDAVHAAWVLHFMSGEEAEATAYQLFQHLKSGGRVYASVAPLYANEWPGLEAEIGKRKQHDLAYPGFFENTDEFDNWSHDNTRPAPTKFHFFDEESFKRVFESQGFNVIDSFWFTRPSTNADSPVDAKKDLGIIVEKP